jgi:hypothetical protein
MRTRQEIERKIQTGYRCLQDACYDALDSKGMEMALNSRDVAYFCGAVQYLQNILEEMLPKGETGGLSKEQKQYLSGVHIGANYMNSHKEGMEEAEKWLKGDNSITWTENFHYHL